MLCKLYFSLLVMCIGVLCKTLLGNGHISRSGYMQSKVVGGVQVPISMYPHVASIAFLGFPYCGSSIISKRVTITAAHCLYDFETEKLRNPLVMSIIVGSAVRGDGVTYKVCNTSAHPEYNLGVFRYDVGLVLISKTFIFGPFVQKIPIVRNNHWRNEKYTFTVAGFGAVSSEGMVLGAKLLATRLRYIDFDECKAIVAYADDTTTLQDGTFCSIGYRWTSDCQGDSGSGIIWKRYLVGVVSAGIEDYCGSDMIPSIYTDIHYFYKWIKKEAKRLKSANEC